MEPTKNLSDEEVAAHHCPHQWEWICELGKFKDGVVHWCQDCGALKANGEIHLPKRG